jgi:hypothetical protein
MGGKQSTIHKAKAYTKLKTQKGNCFGEKLITMLINVSAFTNRHNP